jgi:hypothetical protein
MNSFYTISRSSFLLGHKVKIGQKEEWLTSHEVWALQVLQYLSLQRPERSDKTWLIRYRHYIREIERTCPKKSLVLAISQTTNERVCCLAVWLRGRCCGSLGTDAVSKHAQASNESLRKEVARCLKRLSAWEQLRHLSETDPSPRVRRLASQSPSIPYATRFEKFAQLLRRIEVSNTKPEMMISSEVDFLEGRRPKPQWLIKLILDRIHQLVSSASGRASK